MSENILIILMIVGYIVLQKWILPYFGVKT